MTNGDCKAAAGGVLKVDKGNRVRGMAAQRRAVLEQFARSGLNGPAFARVAGDAYPTFVNGGAGLAAGCESAVVA